MPAILAGQAPNPPDLTTVSLEELMNTEVTSVSKKEQKLSKVGAAVYVITQEDIHRSGASNIPDLLRMAPGVDVSQIDANQWAIRIRGENAHDPFIQRTPGDSRKHQLQLRSSVGLSRNLDWDSSLSYISALSDLKIPAYARVDTRLGWRVGEFGEFSIVGQSLLRPRHLEFADLSGLFLQTEAPRSVSARITWRF